MPGGWEGSTRAQRLPPDWHAGRAACYRNAAGRCEATDERTGQRCTTRPPLHGKPNQPGGHADHINREQGEHGPLQWLCGYHHGVKTSREGNAARPRQTRPQRQHPGLVY